MSNLEQYFDQEKWQQFILVLENIPDEFSLKKDLIEILDGDIELAKVIYKAIGKDSLKWCNNKVPALNNLTPKECLKSTELKNRLKECLMRMDY